MLLSTFVGLDEVITTSADLATTIGTYDIGQSVGGKISFLNAVSVNAGKGIIYGAALRDKNGAAIYNVACFYDLVLFSSDPSVATITDKTAFVFGTDLAKVIGVIPMAGVVADAVRGIIDMPSIYKGIKLTTGTTLYGALINRGTPTFLSTQDVSVDLIIKQAY